MNKFLSSVSIFLLCQQFIYTQAQDSLNFNYHNFRVELAMRNCNGWYNDVKFNTDSKNIYCLNIANNYKLHYFLSNLDDFKHLRSLSIFSVNVKNFSFIKKLPNLEYLSIGVLNNKNINSFVENLNSNDKLELLEISQIKMCNFPKELNELKFIKSLELRNSKRLKHININLNLKQLIFENNKGIKSINADNVDYISISNSDLKEIPKGLSTSKSLKGIKLSLNYKLEITCPIHGFENLKIFDIFGQPSLNKNKVSNNCFLNNKILKIYSP